MAIGLAFPKGEARRRLRDRRRRTARRVVVTVRAVVADRDFYCRLYCLDAMTQERIAAIFGACAGRGEWAHRREASRAKTRGQAPERRHTTTASLMLCHFHHQDDRCGYDRSAFRIEDLTDCGCDGRLRFVARGGQVWEEPA